MASGFDNERCKDKLRFGGFRGVEEERLRDGLSFGAFSEVEEERLRGVDELRCLRGERRSELRCLRGERRTGFNCLRGRLGAGGRASELLPLLASCVRTN